jgi:Tfp pilus assembly protein PilF
MAGWKIIGLLATLLIVIAIPISALKFHYQKAVSESTGERRGAIFVGSEKCKNCHKGEYDLWKGSHHDHAMEVATDNTVLGDFNNAAFEHHGVLTRFYRKESKFFVHTKGPGGSMGEFEITYTFGWYPLQQYLVPFPGGRLQCLPIAWDVKRKRWYHLYPNNPPAPDDWLYWTNAGQNWNGMCAECHSTNLKKNYDVKTKTYETTWSDIDVGCEACHGPGSRHVEWAELPDMARPPVKNFDLVVKTSGLASRELVELCAPCHSRRAILGDYTHAEPDLLDTMLPSLLTEGLYFADGQILEEVYVYGSFTQSKMYHRNVRCSDCHNVHSIKLVKEGNALCLQCHRASEYDTATHHFHKKKGEQGEPIRSADGKVLYDVGTGAACVQCHMPGRTYMGIDYRPDHSLRIPRPDLNVKLGVPDACSRCHVNKTAQWSDEQITRWYGPGRRPHYGSIIMAGRMREPGAKERLVRLAGDPLYPVIVRATALSLLSSYPGQEVTEAYQKGLMDGEPLIRRTAVDHVELPDPQKLATFIGPMLYDQVKAVRIEAAQKLAGVPAKSLGPEQRKVYEAALSEYVASMTYSADFSFGRYNLGNLYVALDRPDEAIQNYRAAIEIDDLFYPAKVNLAVLYSQRGENEKAERLLREVLAARPEMHDVEYSLGLLLAEMKRYEEAAVYLEKASKGMPEQGRIHYNLGLLFQQLKRDSEAEAELLKATEIEPVNIEFLYALADHYLKSGDLAKAKSLAERMIALHPNRRIGHDLLELINRRMTGGNS